MATSGTTTFNLEFDDLIEEAYERCGLENRDGYDMKHCASVFQSVVP
jgi:hypothetical protein